MGAYQPGGNHRVVGALLVIVYPVCLVGSIVVVVVVVVVVCVCVQLHRAWLPAGFRDVQCRLEQEMQWVSCQGCKLSCA